MTIAVRRTIRAIGLPAAGDECHDPAPPLPSGHHTRGGFSVTRTGVKRRRRFSHRRTTATAGVRAAANRPATPAPAFQVKITALRGLPVFLRPQGELGGTTPACAGGYSLTWYCTGE
ncbi:hypothetical protein GCM10010191_59700 [Actinomadura vinacea]|uniref:Uncharacterized protein n=1 Tax=Actinomadura vinacea TaxID=115336 RepID=A0ABN3JTQ1_9ACTN